MEKFSEGKKWIFLDVCERGREKRRLKINKTAQLGLATVITFYLQLLFHCIGNGRRKGERRSFYDVYSKLIYRFFYFVSRVESLS